jgi:hypothetical protein
MLYVARMDEFTSVTAITFRSFRPISLELVKHSANAHVEVWAATRFQLGQKVGDDLTSILCTCDHQTLLIGSF